MTTNQQKYHVLFIPSWYPSRTDLMSGLFVFHHAKSVLKHTDFKVSCLYILPSFEENSKRISKEYSNEEGIDTLRIFIKKENSNFGKIFFWLAYIYYSVIGFFLIKKKYGKPNICHVHVLSRTGILALFLKYFYGIPYIITEHWSRYLPQNSHNYTGFLRKKLTKIIVKKASAVTTVSKLLADAMYWIGLENEYHIVSNVVDTSLFHIIEKHPKKHPKINFVHVSCFDEKAKNIKGILDVIKILKDENHHFTFTIIGDGIDFELVKKHAEILDILDFVSFKGLLLKEKLVAEMAKADCFVLNSNYENQPVVLLESLCCGVPVISTNVGGISEYIKTENGILISADSIDELKNSMLKFINHETNFDAQKLRESVLEIADEKNVAKKFETIYFKTLNLQ